jgi:hypothetical protein
MVDTRTLLAAVLGVALGLLLLAAPGTVIRAQTTGRLPSDRSGEYGRAGEVPRRWRLLVRVVGLAVLALGLYFGWTLV